MRQRKDISLKTERYTIARNELDKILGAIKNRTAESKDEDIKILMYKLEQAQVRMEMQTEALMWERLEVEAQNVELNAINDEMLRLKDLYSDLYNKSPLGYLSVDKKGVIHNANFTAQAMLCGENNELIGRRVYEWVAKDSRDTMYLHLKRVLETGSAVGELRMTGATGEFTVRLDSVSSDKEFGEMCRIALTDITEQRRAGEALLIMIDILRYLNEGGDVGKLIGKVLKKLTMHSSLKNASITIKDGDEYGNYSMDGSTPVQAESASIPCSTSEGEMQECLCAAVLKGCAPDMSAGNILRCIGVGQPPAVIIPLRYRDATLGLMRFVETMPGAISPEILEFLEGIADIMAIALARMQAETAMKSSLDLKDILLKEVNHRVKNNFQVAASLLYLASDNVKDDEDKSLFQETGDRIRSMAMVHEMLYRVDDFTSIDFGEFIREFLLRISSNAVVSRRKVAVDVAADGSTLNSSQAVTLGLIVNELASNAIKHAFSDGRDGRLSITFGKGADGTVSLIVEDDGTGLPAGIDIMSSETMGLSIIRSLTTQLKGTVRYESVPGSRFIITFPG